MVRFFSLVALCAVFATGAIAASAPQGLIAFSSSSGVGGKRQIWVMHPNGSGRHAVGPATANRDAPALSADGRRIAFSSHGDVYVVNVDGTHARRLTSSPGTEGAPAWSRDGRWIAYSSYRSGQSAIWKMRADGSHKVRLTRGTLADVPEWAPNGRRIAFAGEGGDLWVMNADGRQRHRLTKTGNGVDWAPAWSHDGRRIAFESNRATKATNPTNEIWVMNADGSHQVRLTRNSVDDGQPSWSPDNRWIVFASARARGGMAHLWLMRPNGTGVRRATSWAGEQYYPSWAR